MQNIDPVEPVEPAAKSRQRGGGAWGGIVLILLGIVFLLNQFGFEIRNWWAFFILIPALSSFGAAVQLYRRSGFVSYGVRNSLIGGLFPLTVAMIFLLGLSWADYWPMFIILAGISFVSNGLRFGTPDEPSGKMARLYQPWAIMAGLGAMYLGLGFLLNNLNVMDPALVVKNWWAIAILFPAVGGLVTTVLLYNDRKQFDWPVGVNLAITIAVAAPGIVGLLGASWNLVNPIILIALGLFLLFGFRGFERKDKGG